VKQLLLADLNSILKRCPEKGTAKTRPIRTQADDATVVPSFGTSSLEYKVKVLRGQGTWLGECSCKTWKGLEKLEGPQKPCVHIAYCLRELPAFNLDEEVTRAAIEEKAGKQPQEGIPPHPNVKNGKYTPYEGPLEDVTGPSNKQNLQAPGNETGTPAATTETPKEPEPAPLEPTLESQAVEDPEPAAEQAKAPEVHTPPVRTEPARTTPQPIDLTSRAIWPSSLPMIQGCPACVWGPEGEIQIKTTGPAAKVGTAVHEIAKDVVEKDLIALPDPLPYAVKYGIEDLVDEVRILSYFTIQAWRGSDVTPGLKQYFTKPQAEKHLAHTITARNPYNGQMTSFRFSTKIDVLGFSGTYPTKPPTNASVLDWKSGRKHDLNDYLPQMMGMAFVAAAQYPSIETVTTTLVWLRDQTYTTAAFTRDEIRKWALGFVKYSAFWDGKTYRPGPHCRYCPRVAACPGRQQHLTSLVGPLSAKGTSSASLLYDEHGHLRPSEDVYTAYQNAKTLQGLVYSFLDLLKQELAMTGPLAIPSLDGQALGVKPRAGKTSIILSKAKKDIEEYITEEQLIGISSVGKTALRKAIYEASPRGAKKSNFDALLETLLTKGAAKKEPDSQVLAVVAAMPLAPANEEAS